MYDGVWYSLRSEAASVAVQIGIYDCIRMIQGVALSSSLNVCSPLLLDFSALIWIYLLRLSSCDWRLCCWTCSYLFYAFLVEILTISVQFNLHLLRLLIHTPVAIMASCQWTTATNKTSHVYTCNQLFSLHQPGANDLATSVTICQLSIWSQWTELGRSHWERGQCARARVQHWISTLSRVIPNHVTSLNNSVMSTTTTTTSYGSQLIGS